MTVIKSPKVRFMTCMAILLYDYESHKLDHIMANVWGDVRDFWENMITYSKEQKFIINSFFLFGSEWSINWTVYDFHLRSNRERHRSINHFNLEENSSESPQTSESPSPNQL